MVDGGGGEPFPADEEGGRARGCLAEVEDEVGWLLAGGIEARAAGMAGTAPAVKLGFGSAQIEPEEEKGEEERIGRPLPDGRCVE